MKKKKRIVLLALFLITALLAAGCSGGKENIGGSVEQVQNSTEANISGTIETEALTEETEAPTEETEAPVEEEPQVSLGRLEGGVYTNQYTGYGCELDASWTFYSAEELQEIPENVAEMFSDSELMDSDTVLTQITDMMAENVELLASMNVLYQKMSLQERLATAMLDDDALMDAVLEQQDAMIDAYAQAGIIVETMEKKSVTFLGEERVALYTVATMESVPYYALQIMDYDLGTYSATLTLSSYVEDQTESLLELFYVVES